MSYFTHRFDAIIRRHAIAPGYAYTVVYLDPALIPELPLDEHPRLRVEADVSGISFKGAWQPAKGRWFLMLPRAELKSAGLRAGSAVEVAFRLLPQDHVDVPEELAALLARSARARRSWEELTAGARRGLAHLVASAKRLETRTARVARVEAVLLGDAPLPWKRGGREGPRA